MDEPDLQTLLRQGIAAAKAARQESSAPPQPPAQSRIRRLGSAPLSQREQARQLLLQVTELDLINITAWLWLSTVMDTPEEQQICLENALTLAPDNKHALAGLAHLEKPAQAAPPQPPPPPVSPPPSQPAQPAPSSRLLPPQPPNLQPSNSQPSNLQPSNLQPLTPQPSHLRCPFCRKPISAMATTCPTCHLPLAVTCPACQVAVDVEQSECPRCGQAMGSYRQPVTYFAGLGAAYQKQSRPKEALAAWQAVETLKPDYPQVHLRLGEAHLGLGRPDRATESFQRALAQQPNSPDLYFALAELARQRGESREAMRHLLKTTQLNPKHGLAWLRLGQLAEQARLPQDARQAYKRAAALLPPDSSDRQLAQQQLQHFQPALPDTLVAGWPELMRQTIGPMTICLLALLLDSGLRPWWIPWTGWLALLLAFIGIFLTLSGGPLPRNPLIRLILGQAGESSKGLRLFTLIIGLGCCLLAATLILWPLQGQSFPKIPPLPR